MDYSAQFSFEYFSHSLKHQFHLCLEISKDVILLEWYGVMQLHVKLIREWKYSHVQVLIVS